MKLIIDIPDWYYKELQEFKHPNFVDKAIMDGIKLPKGHGKLIDEKVAYRKFYARCLAKEATEVFAETPTIVEAEEE